MALEFLKLYHVTFCNAFLMRKICLVQIQQAKVLWNCWNSSTKSIFLQHQRSLDLSQIVQVLNFSMLLKVVSLLAVHYHRFCGTKKLQYCLVLCYFQPCLHYIYNYCLRLIIYIYCLRNNYYDNCCTGCSYKPFKLFHYNFPGSIFSKHLSVFSKFNFLNILFTDTVIIFNI